MINDSGTTARNLLHSGCRIAMIPADINMPLSPDRLRDALTGVIGFPVTPFHPDLSVDFEALRLNRDGAYYQAFWQSRLMRTRRLTDG